MITETFDALTEEIIKTSVGEKAVKVDACIMTFSANIQKFVLENYKHEQIGETHAATGVTPIYVIYADNKKYAFFLTYEGAPLAAAAVEESVYNFVTDKFIVFGGAGCLNKEIVHGRVMVPTYAYRDEGTSYHYAPASDYIKLKNSDKVAAFMEENGLPYVCGKTWTTDAFFRETRGNMQKRKDDGCISVEMECAALEAVCQYRGYDLYMFFTSGDLLDAPKWDTRQKKGQIEGTQNDPGHFDIAVALADYVS